MKHVKTILILFTLTALMAMPAMAVQLGAESFETTTGWTVSSPLGTPSTSDYCDRYDVSGTVNPAPSGLAVQTGNVDGDWFIAGEDLDGSGLGGPTFTFTLDPISVSGYNNLTVTIACNAAQQLNYDIGDEVAVYANFDNTTDVLVGRFCGAIEDGDDGVNGYAGPDFDLDGDCDYQLLDYANLEDYTFPISGTGTDLVIKVEMTANSGSEEFVFDNVRVDGELGGPTNESDAHVIAGGGGAGGMISSLVDTQAEKQVVHTCQIYDAGDGGMAQNTIIDGLTFVQGNANDISWTTALAGAELFDGVNTYVGVVSSSSISFTFVPALVLTDGGATVDLELAVWLNPLPYYADHSRLEFDLGPANFAVDASGAFFDLTDPVVESGDLNNEIDVVATAIGITTQPPSLVGVNQSFLVRAGFVDENGGVDEDWPDEDITLSVNTGIGNLSAVTGLTIMSSNGQSNFYNLLYDALDTGVILEATSVSFPGPALTDPFDTYLSPTITCDVAPLCWDGDATDEAIPFAVHITIENWSDAAGQDVKLKVYSGSYNPYHYTDEFGWSSSTSYDAKPTVTIAPDGSYSGWLFIKSKGLDTFRPRARLISNTSVSITGVDVFGTALDLTTTGGVLMDSNGSTNAAFGNVILAYNESSELIGSTIAEDNGYPNDNGGYTIWGGGFIMAVCEVCDEEVTYESWNPAFWPGNGTPEDTDTDSPCVEGGAVDEVGIDVILPVELSSFTAVAGDGSVALNWTTASESDLAKFEINRGSESVYTVTASNSANGSEYNWIDSNVNNDVTYNYTLIAVGVDGSRQELETVEAVPSAATVTEYALHQNFPNPFNPETSIRFDMVESGFVTLSVYNVLGQQVATLVNGTMDAGQHVVQFNAANLTSGLYLYRMETNGFTAQMKMVLMK